MVNNATQRYISLSIISIQSFSHRSAIQPPRTKHHHRPALHMGLANCCIPFECGIRCTRIIKLIIIHCWSRSHSIICTEQDSGETIDGLSHHRSVASDQQTINWPNLKLFRILMEGKTEATTAIKSSCAILQTAVV